MKIDATGKRVVVTAGAAGIGRAMARTFAAEGARVWICDIDEAALEQFRAENPGMGAVEADVSDEAGMSAFFDAALADLGGVDALVNNAGIAGPTCRVEDMDFADWRRTMSVNLDSVFLATRLAVPHLKKNGGAIVNLSSVAGRLGVPLRLPYVTSKFGIVGLTETLAMELGPYGISVNALLPGAVEGARLDRVIDARAKAFGVGFEAERKKFLSRISMRTTVTPQEIADMALYLACGPGKHISGQSISICGNVETFSENEA